MKILFINTAPYPGGSFISDLKLANLLSEKGFLVYFSTLLNEFREQFPNLKFINFKVSEILKMVRNFDFVFLTESRARDMAFIIRFLNPKAKIFSVRRAMPKSTKISILIQELFCDKILCISEYIARRIGSKKSYVIYDFVDNVYGIKGNFNSPLIFGYIGRNDYDKGTDILLEAYEAKKFRFVLAGNFEYSEFLKYPINRKSVV